MNIKDRWKNPSKDEHVVKFSGLNNSRDGYRRLFVTFPRNAAVW